MPHLFNLFVVQVTQSRLSEATFFAIVELISYVYSESKDTFSLGLQGSAGTVTCLQDSAGTVTCQTGPRML